MHKLLFGDPYQFKSSEDEVKRIKSFLSPRRTTFDSVELNNKLNKDYNITNDAVIPVGDLFNYQFKDHTITVSLADVEIFSKAYPGVKITETDGFSIIIDGAFREVKIKNAEWSDQAEAWYQWQTAYARRELSNKELYSYPEGHPLSEGKIEIKYMTAKEEDILSSATLIKQGVVITSRSTVVITGCFAIEA